MKTSAGDVNRGILPPTDRERARLTRGTFLFHLRPIRIPRRTVRWTHTFGLGGSSLLLWLTLASTGILVLLVYQPVPDVAYDSVRTMMTRVRFGSLVRGAHYWSANLLVAVVLLHVMRVILTGGYHRPRRVNWIIGVALLLGVLASAVTGYLLPWDQRAFWAITISTGMLGYVPGIGAGLQAIIRGGSDIGAATLLNFYTFHTTVLPVLAIMLMAFHFWRVRKAGGVVEPPADASDAAADSKVMFLPDLLVREVAQGLVLLAVVVVLGALVGAPIGERANPGMSPNPAKAPWYFMGFQELLIHLHPVFAVLVLPLAALAGFAAMPWVGDAAGPAGRWFLSPAARRAAGAASLVALMLCVLAVVLDNAVASAQGASTGWFLRGVLPTFVLAAVTAGVVVAARRLFGLGRNECVQTLVVFLVTGFVALTIIGVFFRGPGMALTLPWGGGG
jgi:quinol-cytochrome oxidoreductase complex cytochrome b subunit